MRIAIDTGGTFTDCVYWKRGELRVVKLASTPDDPGRSMLEAVLTAQADVLESATTRAAAASSQKPSLELRHGTTVGTNALLERKGARIAFVTTAGFEDVLFIGRQARPKLYRWNAQREAPLVQPSMCFGVRERVASDGSVLTAVSDDELRRLVAAVGHAEPQAIAVSLLFAFANPASERAVVAALRHIGVPVSASHEVLPEFREYERASTLSINAYLAPVMEGYLRRLQERLAGEGARLSIMQSSGGIVSGEVAAREPVRTILSGPAGGVIGALEVARRAGFERILTFDMGGTSTDVALIETGKPLETTNESQIAGLPVAVPMLDIHTVGAGGGSLARFDAGGMLLVGPQSAGAVPGPACYGRGLEPTVTDANLVLGRLHPEHFLGGAMRLDQERACTVLERARGSLPGVEAFAEGIVRLADVHMESALRKISIERGHDPRDFALVSFGGAGPLHACSLARALGIRTVVVPRAPGALSALGILESDVVREFSRTVMLPPGDRRIEKHFAEVERAGLREMRREGWEPVAERRVDLRYAGQGYELTVPWSERAVSEFHRLHARRYGYADESRAIEVVNVRLRLIARSQQTTARRKQLRARSGDGRQALLGRWRVYDAGRWRSTMLYDRAKLRSGDRLQSPAVVVEYSATTYLPPGCDAQVDAESNLIIRV
jgi:N-methylhydantoinase A